MGARRVKYLIDAKDEKKVSKDNHQYVPMKRVWGKVKDWDGKPALDAVIRLYKINTGEDLEYIRQIFTDEAGEFDFGLLRKDVDYTLKVWYKEAKVKKVILSEQKYKDDYNDYGDVDNLDDYDEHDGYDDYGDEEDEDQEE